MENFEIMLLGVGVIKSFFFFFFGFDNKEIKDEMVKKEVENQMNKLNPELQNRLDIREVVRWIIDDNFKSLEPYKYSHLGSESYNVKNSFIEFYFKNLEDFISEKSGNNVFDVQLEFGRRVLQLQRLRMVMEPEVQLSKSQHPVTMYYYLSVKGFWIEDTGEKKRKYTRSLGRLENYSDGINDKKAMNNGTEKMREVMWEKYCDIYKQ